MLLVDPAAIKRKEPWWEDLLILVPGLIFRLKKLNLQIKIHCDHKTSLVGQKTPRMRNKLNLF